MSARMVQPQLTGRQEWARLWPLALTAMLGVSGSAIFAFSTGVFIEDITREFGWSRAEFSSAFLLQMILGLFILPATGRVIDWLGPRRVALGGIVPMALAFVLLGQASGSLPQWLLLCTVLALTQGFVAQTVWVTGVISRFHASRGLALAVALAGLGLGAFIWPPLAAFFLQELGWRWALAALGATWAAVVLPMAWFFFHPGVRTPTTGTRNGRAGSFKATIRSPAFLGLMVAGSLFSCSYYGMSVHLVPLLKGSGFSLTKAAAIAGLVGLFSIIGRLLTGWLLDRLPTRPIGVIAFLMPIISAALLIAAQQTPELAIVAVIVLGLASGAELDIITFVAARRFGQDVFATVYSVFMAVISACAGAGPVLAGALFDQTQSYTAFLLTIMPLVGLGAALMAWIPMDSPEDAPPQAGH